MTSQEGHSADEWGSEALAVSAPNSDEDGVAQGAARLAGHLLLALGLIVVLSGLATVGWLATAG